MTIDAFEHILVEADGPIWRVVINRPEVRNAHDTKTFRELVAAFDRAERADECRCVVLTGAGNVFSAGQDLSFTRHADAAATDEYGKWNLAARHRIQYNHKPVLAAVNGPAIGGGVYLATSCDIIVARDTAFFQMREIMAGNHSGGQNLFSIGRARSLEMSLLGKRVDAATALAWGLINFVAPAEEFEATVDQVARELAELPPLGVRYTKTAANVLIDAAGFSAHLDATTAMQHYLSISPDGREAKAAFVEKRKPAFTGALPEAKEA